MNHLLLVAYAIERTPPAVGVGILVAIVNLAFLIRYFVLAIKLYDATKKDDIQEIHPMNVVNLVLGVLFNAMFIYAVFVLIFIYLQYVIAWTFG